MGDNSARYWTSRRKLIVLAALILDRFRFGVTDRVGFTS